jgi:nondiscriminating aspartyl-tRNA synthetase
MKRTYIKDLEFGKEVILKGWIYEIRDLAKLKFILIRDCTGIVQGVIKDERIIKDLENLSFESVIEIKGKVRKANIKAELAIKDLEIEIFGIKIISLAEKLPIQVNEKTITTDFSKRLDYRSLDLRKPKILAIFKIQSKIAKYFREYFNKKNFTEVFLPSIISNSSEGGTDLFSVNYFEKKAYLAQSPQLYKQMMACSIENVFTISPVWRAEKHNTIRHLNESRQMDIEMAFSNQFSVMKELEKAVVYIVKNILKSCEKEIKLLNLNLEIPKAKYLSYDETVKILNMKYGEDLTPEDEKTLNKKFPNSLVFVHSWPVELKPFYIMPKDENINAKLSEGFDCIYRGLEITSGGQRIHIPQLLEEMLKKKKLNPKDFKDYIDSFRFGSPPHAGWSIGLERITQLITEQKNIREACIFPRDRTRVSP